MKKLKFIAVFLLATTFFVACSSTGRIADNESMSANSNTAIASTEPEIAQKTASDSGGGGGGGGENKPIANPQVSLDQAEKSKDEEPAKAIERKIIRNANLELETSKPEDAQRKITSIAESKKGFVITSSQRTSNAKATGRDSVSMQIRVPAEKFQEALDEIRKSVDRVVVETVTGQDVTEEFVDIEARLKTKKALEERFLEIMKQAKSVTDALEVERQLAEVRTEIERIEGRKRFLENQTSLSTLNIELRTPAAISASSTGFFYELTQAISDGFEAALTFILVLIRVLIALLPFLLLIVLPAFLILRYFWRKYKKKRTARKIVEEELEEAKIIDVE